MSVLRRILGGRGDRASWPVELRGRTPGGEQVVLRELRAGDEPEFVQARSRNASWLRPWDATPPVPGASEDFGSYQARMDSDARRGAALPFVVVVDGRLVGQLTVSSIILGSFRSCTLGYWVVQEVAGRGIAPTAVALAGDHVLGALGLHRVEINIRPENTASLAVVRKLSLRDEGLRARYLHIDGDWRDHRSFAVLAEDLGEGGLMGRLHAAPLG